MPLQTESQSDHHWAYADAARNARLRLTVKRNTVQLVAEQRDPPGECLQDAGSPDGLRRFRYFLGRSLNGIAVKRKHLRRHRLKYSRIRLKSDPSQQKPRSFMKSAAS